MIVPALVVLGITALATTASAQIAVSGNDHKVVEKEYWVFGWDGARLIDSGHRVKVNGGPAAIRTAEK